MLKSIEDTKWWTQEIRCELNHSCFLFYGSIGLSYPIFRLEVFVKDFVV